MVSFNCALSLVLFVFANKLTFSHNQLTSEQHAKQIDWTTEDDIPTNSPSGSFFPAEEQLSKQIDWITEDDIPTNSPSGSFFPPDNHLHSSSSDDLSFDNEEASVSLESKPTSETAPSPAHLNNQLDNSVNGFMTHGTNIFREASEIFFDELNRTHGANQATDVWLAYSKSLSRVIESVVQQALPQLLDSGSDLEVSGDCLGSIFSFINGVRGQKDWAMKLFDSSGNPIRAGYLEGSVTDLGAFDQCLKINVSEFGEHLFNGQYCLLEYTLPLPPKPDDLTLQSKVFNFTGTVAEDTFLEEFSKFAHAFYERSLRLGICIPSTCSREDFENVISRFITYNPMKLKISSCQVSESKFHMPVLGIVIIAIFSILIFLMVIATSIDLVISYLKDPDTNDAPQMIRVESAFRTFMASILAFSVYKNGTSLFNTDSPAAFIDCVNGIRVLSMVWILYTHTYLIPIKETFAFATDFMYAVENLLFQFVLNGWVLVDTFFLVGAMLTTYNFLLHMNRSNGKLNLINIILSRFFRLSPSVWFTVLLAFLIPSLANGPLWHEYFDYQMSKCYYSWWATIFFFNNWLHENDMCLLHTWYLSSDFQLFLFAIAFLILLYKKPNLGLIFILSAIAASCLAIGIRTFLLRQNATVIYNTPIENEIYHQFSRIYVHTYIHLGPYFIGIIVGYLIFKRKQYRFNPYLRLILWLTALGLGMGVLLATHPLNSGQHWSRLSNSFYAGLHRTAWSLCIGWTIFACATGHGGPINTFLSWKLFAPFGKLCYMIYLVHFLIIWMRFAYVRTPIPFSHYTMFCEFIVNLVISVFVAMIAHLGVEVPAMNLYRIHLGKRFQWATINVEKSVKKMEDDQVMSTRL